MGGGGGRGVVGPRFLRSTIPDVVLTRDLIVESEYDKLLVVDGRREGVEVSGFKVGGFLELVD